MSSHMDAKLYQSILSFVLLYSFIVKDSSYSNRSLSSSIAFGLLDKLYHHNFSMLIQSTKTFRLFLRFFQYSVRIMCITFSSNIDLLRILLTTLNCSVAIL